MTNAIAWEARQVDRTDENNEKPDDVTVLLNRVATDPTQRIKLLHQLLGESACRHMGVYPIPPGFKLSVVIPVYN